MKAVLIATDFLKDNDGSFKTLETNTGIHFVIKNVSNYLNVSEFDNFLSENNIDTIEFINPTHNFDDVYDVDADKSSVDFATDTVEGFLADYYSGTSINFTLHKTNYGAVTVPYIEDSPNKLILRVSFDTTALIDDTYARDNWEFLKLMYDNEPTSIPKTYVNDLNLGFDTIGTDFRDNNGYPNFIIKERFPTLDYRDYPKVLKVESTDELNTLKNSLTENEYLQEYIYNPNDVIEGKLKTYRTITMVYGNNLDSFNFMSPYVLTNSTTPSSTVDYDDNGFIQVWERPSFIQKLGLSNSANAIKNTYHFDETSKIILTDGNLKNIDELLIGDGLKTLDIEGLPSDIDDIMGWSEDYTTITGSTDEITTLVESIQSKSNLDWLVNIILEDGIKFSDLLHSSVLSLDKNDNSKVKFTTFQQIEEGDNFLIYDLSTQTYIIKNVISVEYTYEKINVYTLDVEPQDAFLTAEEGVESPRYVMLQHNPPGCLAWCCTYDAGWAFEQCINGGGSGYCGQTNTYEYCAPSSPAWHCYQCAPGCANCNVQK
jgi:hypothetical protein